MMTEVWKKIAEYPLYEVSNQGRVRSWSAPGVRPFLLIPKILKLKTDSGYKRASFSLGGKIKQKLVHRLVLEAFVGACPENFQACHNDGIRDNNHVSNLRWDSAKNNGQDKVRHGKSTPGEKNNKAKLKELEVKEIRRLIGLGVETILLSKMFLVNPTQIRKIGRRKAWAHI